MANFEKRFWTKVNKLAIGCWIWIGAVDSYNGLSKAGYGVIRTDGGRASSYNLKAHRVAYELLVGPVPHGMELDHLCRNRLCVNPAHLEPVTRGENNRRGEVYKTNKRRFAAMTTCRRGHPRNEQNCYYTPAGTIHCRICTAASARASRQRKKESS